MAICTLVSPPAQKKHRSVLARSVHTRPVHPRPQSVTARRVAASNLETVEDRLLERSLSHHPHHEAALDSALDDMAALSAEVQQSRRRPLLLRSATNLGRIEDLLLEAIVRTHPNRERALDRILGDMCCAHEEIADDNDDAQARAEFDASIDNDFDGMA